MAANINIAFTDFWHSDAESEVRANPLYRLLSKRFELRLSEQPDFLLYSCFGRRHLRYPCTRIFYSGENQRPDFDRCDYAFTFDELDEPRHYRLPLYRLYGSYQRIPEKGQDVPNATGRKFCNFLYSNRKARERIDFFRRLEQYRTVDSGGRVLNNLGRKIGDKQAFLGEYKFTIAFENASHPGYTTEKLLEALVANTVPIYWGNPRVAQEFNPAGFINCDDYENFDAVVERVIELDKDDELYLAHLAAPVFPGGLEPDYLRESTILDRFEQIFSAPRVQPRSRILDSARYWLGGADFEQNLRRWVRARREVSHESE